MLPRAPPSTDSGAARPARSSERKRLDPAQRVIARGGEAPIDGALHPLAQRPEGRGRRQRRRRGDPRRPAAGRDAEPERDRGVDARQQQRQHAVDERAVDQPVDVVEPVAQHRHTDRDRDRAQHQDHGDREDGVVVRDQGFDEAHQHRRRDQEGRVGEPLQLEPLDPGGAPEAHAHRPRRRDQGADGAEEDERPQPFDRGHRGHRARHVLVWRIELLGREDLDHSSPANDTAAPTAIPSPARGRQPAVREDQDDRRHRGEEQRPQRMSASTAQRPPGSAPGSSSTAYSAYAPATPKRATTRPLASSSQPIGFPGCLTATRSPTTTEASTTGRTPRSPTMESHAGRRACSTPSPTRPRRRPKPRQPRAIRETGAREPFSHR